MKTLLLCNYDVHNAAMVTEHINAIVNYSRHDIFVYTDLVRNNGDLALKVNLNEFEAIIIHYSIFVAVEQYFSTRTRRLVADFKGVKIIFLQDEYRFVDRTIIAMKELGIDVLFSCVPEHSINSVYPPSTMGAIRVVNTLTGYPSEFLSVLKPIQLARRKYDVSYRGRRYPDWHGALGREKFEIAEKFVRRSRRYGLRTNISCREKDRLYGAKWVWLLQNSRAVLGVESGSSVFDFSGEISVRTETQRALLGQKGVTYNQLQERFFSSAEGKIDLAQISPRVFEAICLRTMCILYEGNYSGLLEPNVHYLPLKKDFSNIGEVCLRVQDNIYVSEIITNAYNDIAHGETHTNRNFVRALDMEIKSAGERKGHNLPEQNEPQALRQTFNKFHPFVMLRFPHVAASHGWVRRLIISLKGWLPGRVKLLLRSIKN